jgi:hypothetical protein
MGALRFLALVFSVGMALASSVVEADELVLPYRCTMDRGAPHLTPSEMMDYRIIGSRQDQSFTACGSSAAWSCETMMVHKFTVECGGQHVAWARVAASARILGVAMPDGLPAGYAPISRLKGRFVLPGFGKKTAMSRVTAETLSRDAVIEPAAQRIEPEQAPWVTVVDPVMVQSDSGDALKVAGVISTLLVSLMIACLFLVRRRQFPAFEFAQATADFGAPNSRIWDFAAAPLGMFGRRFWRSQASSADTHIDDVETSQALAPARTRLNETEFLVSMLPADLLLRNVLTSELDGLHDRVADLERRESQFSPDRLKSALRSIMRDLDRIGRIAQGAMPASEEMRASTPEPDAPSTIFEAYRALGLNPDAPDAAVKKIVDALRMSWHPDHARDEADRRYREARIKQVNAAWDLLKIKLAAAA